MSDYDYTSSLVTTEACWEGELVTDILGYAFQRQASWKMIIDPKNVAHFQSISAHDSFK